MYLTMKTNPIDLTPLTETSAAAMAREPTPLRSGHTGKKPPSAERSTISMTRLLTPKQVCETLGICFRTLTLHINSGELPYILMGSGAVRQHRMFEPNDIEVFKNARRRVACPSIQEPMVSIATTSKLSVFDFAARLASVRDAKPKPSSAPRASKPKSKSRPSKINASAR
jgi:hypothetical protein